MSLSRSLVAFIPLRETATKIAPKSIFGEVQPLGQGMHRAGQVAGAARDLDLAPAGLAAQAEQGTAVEDLDPAPAFWGVVLAVIERDDFRPAQASCKTYQLDRPIAQSPQIVGQGGQHIADVVGQDCFLLNWRPRVLAADAGEDGGNVAVLAVKGDAALPKAPGQTRQPPLDGRDRQGSGRRLRGGLALRRGQIGNVEADQLGRRGRRGRLTCSCCRMRWHRRRWRGSCQIGRRGASVTGWWNLGQCAN